MNRVLWVIQALLAALFLFAGVMKFVMPVEMMAEGTSLPGPFFWFIGAAEILGALGLVLPGLFKIRPELTPLAAAGLTIIMAGAVVTTVAVMDVASAAVPFVVFLLVAFVTFGRARFAPLRARRSPRGASLQPTG